MNFEPHLWQLGRKHLLTNWLFNSMKRKIQLKEAEKTEESPGADDCIIITSWWQNWLPQPLQKLTDIYTQKCWMELYQDDHLMCIPIDHTHYNSQHYCMELKFSSTSSGTFSNTGRQSKALKPIDTTLDPSLLLWTGKVQPYKIEDDLQCPAGWHRQILSTRTPVEMWTAAYFRGTS